MSGIRGPVLLYDGTCGFCAESIRFVLDREGTRHDLQFAQLTGPVAAELIARRPELKSVDSVIWFEHSEGEAERVLVQYAGALQIAQYLGGWWALAGTFGRLVPSLIGNAVYDFVARHRHRITGRDRCVVPTVEQRSRFLDPD